VKPSTRNESCQKTPGNSASVEVRKGWSIEKHNDSIHSASEV